MDIGLKKGHTKSEMEARGPLHGRYSPEGCIAVGIKQGYAEQIRKNWCAANQNGH
jgi:hypothetical protein